MNFIKAKPIFAKDKSRQMNCLAGFRTVVKKVSDATIFIACSTMYQLFINNEFVAYGPARTAEGFHRIDKLDIGEKLTKDENVVSLLVLGQNCDTYMNVMDTSFLTCEIAVNNEIVSFTDKNGSFDCRILKEWVVKTYRYSYQRGFTESRNFDPSFDNWCKDANDFENLCEIEVCEEKKYLERRAPYPEYEKTAATKIHASGKAFVDQNKVVNYDSLYQIPKREYQYKNEELELNVVEEAGHFAFEALNCKPKEQTQIPLESLTFSTVETPYLMTGFFGFNIDAKEDTTLYCYFDEILTDGDIDYLRATCVNVIKLIFKKGRYTYLSYEPVTFKFIKILCSEGSCVINGFHVAEYKHPPVLKEVNIPKDEEKLSKIYKAAVETFRQNAVDIYMDCPGRERAGWLCDSFFTSRVERFLTDESVIESDFLENFILPDGYYKLADGILPMCYPSCHSDGRYIPNWAMWFVLEAEEYVLRTNNRDFKVKAKQKIYGVMNFLKKFENSDGLLESLESWIFVEWSKANELVDGVNYPSNMLYSAMLSAISRMYDDKELGIKAEQIADTIREKSFNGKFFTDNAVRKDGTLVNTNEATEVCQYYAFFLKIASPDTHKELWETLVNDFGPNRKENNKYPEIYFANAFIGNYLRIDCLLQYGYEDKVLDNIKGYFYKMAEKTGTLWEHDSTEASCDHGFASYVIYWLGKIYTCGEHTYGEQSAL